MKRKRRGNQHLYLGKAGQSVVMSEFLCLGWNVAVPEVDVGDDIFVVKDKSGDFTRIQVKTSKVVKAKNKLKASFDIPQKQLKTAFTPELTYVLVSRYRNKWYSIIIIKRKDLRGLMSKNKVGGKSKIILLNVYFDGNNVIGSKKIDLTKYNNHWKDFPVLRH